MYGSLKMLFSSLQWLLQKVLQKKDTLWKVFKVFIKFYYSINFWIKKKSDVELFFNISEWLINYFKLKLKKLFVYKRRVVKDAISAVFQVLLVAFPRNLAQHVRRYKSTSVRKLFFDSFCVFGVMRHYAVEKEIFYYAFSYSIEYNAWDLNLFSLYFLHGAFNHSA